MLKKIALLLLLLLNGLCSLRAQVAPPLALTLPKDGAHVPLRPCLSGTADENAGPIFPIVFALAVNTYYVQAPVTAARNRFLTMPYIGEEGRHAKERFQVVLVQGPHEVLAVGQELRALPAADVKTPAYEFVRDDRAPDYCDVTPPPTANSEQGATIVAVAGEWPSMLLMVRMGFALLIVLFAALVVRIDLAEKILEHRALWFTRCLSLIERKARVAGASIKGAAEALFTNGTRSATVVYHERTRIQRRLVWAGTLAALVCVAPLCIGVETLLLMSRLGTVIDTQFGASAGFLFGDATERALPAIDWLTGALHSLQNGGLLIVALGLAFLQGLAGSYLFWGDDAHSSLTPSFRAMFRQRPIPFTVFVFLDFSLAVVAGLSGANRPVDFPWWVPAIVSALIGLTVPWIAAYSLHFALELAGGILSPVVVLGCIVVITVFFAAATIGWILCWAALLILLVAVSAAMGCIELPAFVFAGAAYLCGAAAEKTMEQLGLLMNRRIAWRPVTVVVSCMLAAYLVTR